MNKIKVLVIDDSAVIRRLLSEILSTDREIEVVGAAMDPYIARNKIKQLRPDVLTLDIEMPKMDGISFLKNIMRLRPMPVVMISSLTEAGADVALQALELGAVDYICKPKVDAENTLEDYAEEIIAKVKTAARVRVFPGGDTASGSAGSRDKLATSVALKRSTSHSKISTADSIIAMGASTGGTEAIKEILVKLQPNGPPVLITQHIPKAFSAAFARRMNDLSQVSVCEATDGQKVLAGHVYIAPGDKHLKLMRKGAVYYCQLDDGDPVNRHKPSVDILFESVAHNAGPNATGILLTGMGRDGARGLLEMFDSGAYTIAQDEKSSIVWGMPGEAVKLGAASIVLPLNKIVSALEVLSNVETKPGP